MIAVVGGSKIWRGLRRRAVAPTKDYPARCLSQASRSVPIPILKRYDIPGTSTFTPPLSSRCADHAAFAEHLLPPDSRVEIDAKIAAGYFTSGKKITEADLVKTVGRTWEETEH